MVGTQIGSYRIDEKIGEGGMGTVYRAMEVNLDRPVAIKVLNANVLHNPALVERFRAEARAQANLNHTNIATLYTLLIHADSAMMVMEFVQGENFQQMVARRGPIPAEEAIPLFKQALLGIACAHRVGIVHRDIKPANLMLNQAGIVKVMDFGIAKAVGERGMTRTGLQVGTVHYMSPEQVKSDAVDIRSDIYALGITLYEMVSGRVPFNANSEFDVLTDHVKTSPPLPSLFCSRISKGLENIILKALEKDPEDRFQSVEEFGAALDKPELWQTFVAKSQQTGLGLDRTRPLSYDSTLFESATKPPVVSSTSPSQEPQSQTPPSSPPLVSAKPKKNNLIWIAAAALLLLAVAGYIGYRMFAPKPPAQSAVVVDGKAASGTLAPPVEAVQSEATTVFPDPSAPATATPGAGTTPNTTTGSGAAPGSATSPKTKAAATKPPIAEYPPPPAPAPFVMPPETEKPRSTPQVLTVPASEQIVVRLIGPIDGSTVQIGQDFDATIDAPVLVNQHVAIPKGVSAQVHVVDFSKAGRFKGSAHLTLTLKSITVSGRVLKVDADLYDASGGSRGKRTGKFAAIGGAIGAVVGGVTHGGKGAAEGAGAGGGAGAAGAAATGSTSINLPAESIMAFHLVSPLVINR